MRTIAVIIASRGRPADLALWLGHVERQTLKPAALIWSVHSAEDLPDIAARPGGIAPIVCWSALGLCHQRNAGLAAVPPGTDIVAFFDDDYIPSSRCLEGIARAFDETEGLVGVTGHVIADGITGAGISVARAQRLIAAYDAKPPPRRVSLAPFRRLYGCNMAYLASRMEGLMFDGQLPLYAWQEDVDFGARIGQRGLIGRSNAFAGVHRGAKHGRTSGKRFGYSQIANILYLCRKRTLSWPYGMLLMWRNILANHGRLLWPEPWVDRRGRAAGNWIAFRDLMRGRLHPMRALDL